MKCVYSVFFGCIWALLSQKSTAFQWSELYSYTWQQADRAFRAGQYSKSVTLYQLLDNSDAAYNQGNALAYLADYSGAIAAYDRALQKNPQNQDALFNRQIIMTLLSKAKPPEKKSTPHAESKKNEPNKPSQKKQEQQLANKQWINLIPDETGSFLQEKFLRDYLSRR